MTIDLHTEITHADVTFTHAINADDLPENVRPIAARLEDFTEKREDAIAALTEATNSIKVAERADAETLKNALLAGGKDPGSKNTDTAHKRLADAERNYRAIDSIVRETAPKLRSALWANREQIAGIAQPKVAEAIENYRAAVVQAEALVNAAASALEATAPIIGLVEDIDARIREGIGYSHVSVERYDATSALARADQLTAHSITLTTAGPAAVLDLRMPDGTTMSVKADSATAMIQNGATLITQ